ncbi:hypothetical protein GCK72_021231 [Caenorhabditis remanei]|uniref:F-box domain-containing protein n=1 Tax=Caenorhabditis remanei TaxID=31234 RepID=A0A6A5GHI7_CAERE|nr:hypothetical protein GCK72_021231 [Caenorhabditis remanei]KAF1754668.1 hypothetical protein GCK72_021231 [Caenorhabditis remanei]
MMFVFPERTSAASRSCVAAYPQTPPDIESSSQLYPLSPTKMTTPFPLLRLPRLALIPVFQRMEDIEILAFCHISTRTRSLTKYLKLLSPEYVVLKQHDVYIEINLNFSNRAKVILSYVKNPEDSVDLQSGTTTWSNMGFSIGEWTKRMFDVSNCDKFETVMLEETPEFDFFSIFSENRKIDRLVFLSGCEPVFVKQALRTLIPITSNIEFLYTSYPFRNRTELRQMLVHEMDSLEIRALHCHYFPFVFNLDDLIASNVVKLVLRSVTLTANDLNEFFKMWKQNTCNLRLEHLSVLDFKQDDRGTVIKGLKIVEAKGLSCLRYFQCTNDGIVRAVLGGFDIKRADGKIGTIAFGADSLDFYVWS